MSGPRWLTIQVVLAFHSSQIQEHGGAPGIRDAALLESALQRPLNKQYHASGTSLMQLAAAYGYGIARNHPFVDGNKRVAFQAMYVFLRLNRLRIDAPEPEVVHVIMALAAGEIDEAGLADWLERHGSAG